MVSIDLASNNDIHVFMIKLNYDEKKVKIKNIIQSWSKRSLTLFGKVTIIKSLIVPQLTYLLSPSKSFQMNYPTAF
jgi:hypothetical protein